MPDFVVKMQGKKISIVHLPHIKSTALSASLSICECGHGYRLFSNLKISIHEFIWNHYSKNINTKEPSSMANLEKSLKQKFNSIKDQTIHVRFVVKT